MLFRVALLKRGLLWVLGVILILLWIALLFYSSALPKHVDPNPPSDWNLRWRLDTSAKMADDVLAAVAAWETEPHKRLPLDVAAFSVSFFGLSDEFLVIIKQLSDWGRDARSRRNSHQAGRPESVQGIEM
jgi:hypothetical protein